MARQNALPRALPPRLISRQAAAAYLNVSPTTFDVMVRDGRMPRRGEAKRLMQPLLPLEKITGPGIIFERLTNSDGVFCVNVMADCQQSFAL
jgi:hypothetical protein